MNAAKRKANKQILPALAAVGGACGLAASPVSALELGNIRVDSVLGQPLRASIAYALAPNEQLYGHCIFLRPAASMDGMPVVADARVTITDHAIVLNGRLPVREPLLSVQLSVRCAYTARLARDYTLMIDPALPTEGERAALSTEQPPMTPAAAAPEVPEEVRPAPAVRRPTPRPRDVTPIEASSRYLVQPGDSVSEIAARIENRSIALWPAVDAIFSANPHAFLDNDPNLLKAGSWLDIPDMSGAPATADRSAPAPQQSALARSTSAHGGVPAADSAAEPEASESPQMQLPLEAPQPQQAVPSQTDPAAADEPALVGQTADEPETAAEPADAPSAGARAPELRPGDVVIGTDNPFVVPGAASEPAIDIPDTEMEAPPAARPVPGVAVTQTGDGGISGGWSWLLWLGGAGVALILGLLMFGRPLRERFGRHSIAIPDVPARRRDDRPTPRTIVSDIDFNFDADTLTPRKIDLDADLADGSGLQDSSDLDVAQDFGYSATDTDTAVDMEITEQAAAEEKPVPTDVIPPQARDADSILKHEILPEAEDDREDVRIDEPDSEEEADYSMSMRIDMTKQLLDDNTATTKNLQAVMLDTDVHDSDDTGSFGREVDYQILEQDYEEELTATQALNKEIEEAARALAEQMGEPADGGNETAEMPASPDPEITAELTSNLPASGDAENEEFGNTGADALDLTLDLPTADDDATLDAEVTIERKKSEAS